MSITKLYMMPSGGFPSQEGLPVLVTQSAFENCCCGTPHCCSIYDETICDNFDSNNQRDLQLFDTGICECDAGNHNGTLEYNPSGPYWAGSTNCWDESNQSYAGAAVWISCVETAEGVTLWHARGQGFDIKSYPQYQPAPWVYLDAAGILRGSGEIAMHEVDYLYRPISDKFSCTWNFRLL